MKSEDTLFMFYVLRITLQLDIRPSFISAFIHDTVLHTDVAIEEEPVASGAAGEDVAGAVVEERGARTGVEEDAAVQTRRELRGVRVIALDIGDPGGIAMARVPLGKNRIERHR